MTTRKQQSINPTTGIKVAEYDLDTAKSLNEKLTAASQAFNEWSRLRLSDRSKFVIRAAKLLEKNERKYAELITVEMGKPITQSRAEIQKCKWVCEFYAKQASIYLAEERIPTDASISKIVYEPLGPILAVMPWNFPFWQVIRFAAPSLMAGNVGILKHASNVPGCALALEEMFIEAGFPEGVFQSLLVDSGEVSRLISNPVIRAVTLTGSEGAGKSVGAAAGESLKKVVLELGGSDAFIVLDDADIDATVSAAVTARAQNAGQSCIAAKRFIVTSKLSRKFTKAFVDGMRALRVGDPLNEDTDVGPLVSKKAVADLHKMVLASIKRGGKLLCGGSPIRSQGFYYEPTIISEVGPGFEVFDEETFGPVAAISTVKNAEDAVKLANQSRFGLGASIWSKDVKGALSVAKRIEAGSVFINSIVKSDPRLPFGGVKSSGHGRELSAVGIREFTNIKTIWAA